MSARQTIQLRETVSGPATRAIPVASVIVLHGLGTDGRDFAPLVKELDLTRVGPCASYFPTRPGGP